MFDTKYLPKDYNPDRDPSLFKWFIENPNGEWAADPNSIRESWTRDPLKAWTFENISLRLGWSDYDTCHPEFMFMIIKLQREGLFENCTLTKHEFILSILQKNP